MDLTIKVDNNYFARKTMPFNQSKNTKIRINTTYNSNCNNSTQDKQLVFGINLLKIFQKPKVDTKLVKCKITHPHRTRDLYKNINEKLTSVIETCTKKIETGDWQNSYYDRNNIYLESAKAYAGLGNFDAALEDCCYTITGQKSDAALQQYLARFNPEKEILTTSERCFAKIFEIKKLTSQMGQKTENIEEIYTQRASCYLDLGLSDNAILDLKSAAILYKIPHKNAEKLSSIYTRIGFIYISRKNAQEAIKYFKMAKRCDRANMQAANMYNELINGYKFN